MSVELAAIIIIGGLMLLLALGVEIAISMGIMAAVGFIFFIDQPHIQIAWTAWGTLNSFTLLAMPLFIFMGAMFANTGVVRTLFEGTDKWVGFLPGGLASAVIAASAVFGAMSGSSIAAAATFSLLSFPEMEKRGYNPKLAFGSIAIGGTLSVLIPPSLILIVFGSWENQSVARLFAAALVPGFLLAVMLVMTVVVIVLIKPGWAPKSPPVTWKERLSGVKQVLPWLGVIGLVLGVIFGGVMSPTEAAALGAFISIFICWAYGLLTFNAIKQSFLTAIKVSAMIGFVLFTARLLAFVFQASGLTDTFSAFILNLPVGKYGTVLVICIMYLILGMFFDSLSMMLLTLPFVMPAITNLGFDPIWWGVVYVILAEIGLVTPPFGLNLFTIHGVLPQYSILEIAAGTLPFLIPMCLIIVLLVIYPEIALWLPKLLY